MVLRTITTVVVAAGVEVPESLDGHTIVNEILKQVRSEATTPYVFFNGDDDARGLDLGEKSRWRRVQ